MRYYSDALNKIFDSEEELFEAERKNKEKGDKREERYKELKSAIEAAEAAQEKANDLTKAYIKDYGWSRIQFPTIVHDNEDFTSLLKKLFSVLY